MLTCRKAAAKRTPQLQSPHSAGRRTIRKTQLCSNVRKTAQDSSVKASAATTSSAPVKKQDQESFILSTVSDMEDERRSSNDRASSQSAPSASGRDSQDASDSQYWQELLSSPEPEMFGHRAKSASDAAVLRRKGHLKEQDKMIEFLLAMHHTHTSEEVMQKMDRWIMEHRQEPRHSRLKKMVPSVGSFFTPLKLVDAFREFDQFFALSRRKYVPPNFAEMRHILNIAQVTHPLMVSLLCHCTALPCTASPFVASTKHFGGKQSHTAYAHSPQTLNPYVHSQDAKMNHSIRSSQRPAIP